jgi:hypothetical protein
MNEKIGRCHDCTAPQTEVNILSRHILELQADKGRLTDSVRELEEKLANADYQLEGRDLEIKELQKENAELKKVAEFQQSSNISRHFENKKLKEGLAVGSTFNKALNSINKNLEEERDKYRNMVFDKDEQLTKAKELLKQWLHTSKASGCDNINIVTDTEQFLSEVEK